MNYGKVTIFAGPMFCGKTTHLMQQFIWKNHANNHSLLIKPAFDNRYGVEEVVTHNGLRVSALNVTSVEDIEMNFQKKFYSNLMIDECQFFIEPHFHGDLIACVKNLLKKGINVYASGLDMDWRGDPFHITAYLLAMADEALKLKSVCNFSGEIATKTYKKSLSGGSVELGETDKYEVRSNQYWRYE